MLPTDRMEWVEGWGEVLGGAAFVYRPSTIEGIRAALGDAQAASVPVALRGAGCSYGDASLRPESVILDLSRMDRILAWDCDNGVIEVEPGVTLRRLWRYVLGDGWWPPVVTGTMETTIGGCLGMNVHGKNNWARGTFGEHCLEFDLLTVDGTLKTVSKESDRDLFYAVIGSFGMLGIITRAKLQMKKTPSGLIEAKAVSAKDLETLLRLRHLGLHLAGLLHQSGQLFHGNRSSSGFARRRAAYPTISPSSISRIRLIRGSFFRDSFRALSPSASWAPSMPRRRRGVWK